MQIVNLPNRVTRADAFQSGIDRMAQGLTGLGNVISRKEALEYERQRQAEQDALAEQERRAKLAMQYDQAAINAGINPMQGASANQRQEFINQGGATGLTGALGDAILRKQQEDQARRMFLENEKLRSQRAQTTPRLTESQKSYEREAGKQLAEYTVGGGKANINKNIGRFKGAIERLAEPGELTGGLSTKIPFLGSTVAQEVINPEMTSVRDDIYSAIQTSLKQILGGQFTEKEAEQMFSRAFNPRLSDEENVRRAKIELAALENMAQNKEAAGEYFRQKGSLIGFKPEQTQPAQRITQNRLPPQSLTPLADAYQTPGGPQNTSNQNLLINDAMAGQKLDITSPEKTQARQSRIIQLKRKAGLIK